MKKIIYNYLICVMITMSSFLLNSCGNSKEKVLTPTNSEDTKPPSPSPSYRNSIFYSQNEQTTPLLFFLTIKHSYLPSHIGETPSQYSVTEGANDFNKLGLILDPTTGEISNSNGGTIGTAKFTVSASYPDNSNPVVVNLTVCVQNFNPVQTISYNVGQINGDEFDYSVDKKDWKDLIPTTNVTSDTPVKYTESSFTPKDKSCISLNKLGLSLKKDGTISPITPSTNLIPGNACVTVTASDANNNDQNPPPKTNLFIALQDVSTNNISGSFITLSNGDLLSTSYPALNLVATVHSNDPKIDINSAQYSFVLQYSKNNKPTSIILASSLGVDTKGQVVTTFNLSALSPDALGQDVIILEGVDKKNPHIIYNNIATININIQPSYPQTPLTTYGRQQGGDNPSWFSESPPLPQEVLIGLNIQGTDSVDSIIPIWGSTFGNVTATSGSTHGMGGRQITDKDGNSNIQCPTGSAVAGFELYAYGQVVSRLGVLCRSLYSSSSTPTEPPGENQISGNNDPSSPIWYNWFNLHTDGRGSGSLINSDYCAANTFIRVLSGTAHADNDTVLEGIQGICS